MMTAQSSLKQHSTPLTVSHVIDYYWHYLGEIVTFFTRVDVHEPLPSLTVGIAIPEHLQVADYWAPADHGRVTLEVQPDNGEGYLVWNVKEPLSADTRYEYTVEARIAPTDQDLILQSRAVASSDGPNGDTISAEETLMFSALAKARYLQYLPAIYREDEFMGRFLMVFESFWAPILRQINGLSFYFDPRMTPSDFLPWLASWLGLVLDERWPEESLRKLLCSAALLYRKRGTKQGLQDYLELFTGAEAKIIEHRAFNFRLGPEARLGPGIALGTGNQPHTFTVVLQLPPALSSGSKEERAQAELERRRIIEDTIKAQKPAHTSYRLRIEIVGERTGA